MDKNRKVPHNDYSVDEILAETQLMKNRKKEAPEQAFSPATDETSGGEKDTAASLERRERPEEIVRQARSMLNMEAGPEGPENTDGDLEPEPPKKKKGWPWHRKHREFVEEEDIYYGLQLRPLEEYRREYEKSMTQDTENSDTDNGDDDGGQSSFPYLFRQDSPEQKQELSETFERIHQERQQRLERIMRQAGLDESDLFDQEIPPRPQPVSPPSPEHSPEVEPPQPPSVTPGPKQEPEIRPPVTEPVPQNPDIRMDGEIPDKGTGEPVQKNHSSPTPNPDETAPVPEPPKDRDTVAPLKAEEQAPASIKEPSAVPPREKEERPAPPSVREPGTEKRPSYRARGRTSVQVIDLNCFDDVLVRAAECYQIKPLEPIPFPKTTPVATETVNVPRPSVLEPEPGHSTDTVSVSVEPIPLPAVRETEPEPPLPEKKKKFRLFGAEEPESDAEEDFEKPEKDELDDFTGPADEPSVLHDLISDATRVTLRLVVTGILTILLAGLSLAAEHPALLGPELHTFFTGQPVLIIQLTFLLIAIAFSFPALWNGLSGLCTFKSNTDSAIAVAVTGALLQNALLLIFGQSDNIHVYSSLAVAALFLNYAGKFSMMKRILHNFRFLTAKEKKFAVRLYDDYNTALKLSGGHVEGDPEIAYQSETGFLKHFLRLSYAPDPSDRVSLILGPAGFIASLILCGVCAFLTRSAINAVTVFAASACICVPFSATLSVNLPLARLNRLATQNGAMLAGWTSVEHFCNTNAVMVDAKDLFPRGTVILNGIKTFAGQRIDDAILDATALTCSIGGPLSDLFDQIIKSRRDLLPKISEPVYEDGRGVTGIVSQKQILVGNRELLKAHGVEPPSRDYEKKYLAHDKKLVYLASAGTLVAVFILSYHSDRRRALELRRMECNGISLIVRTRDPNITPRLLSDCFGIGEPSVSVLPETLGKICDSLKESPPDRTEALLATRGRATSMMRMLVGCVRQRRNISVAVALQSASAALGFALVAFLSLYSGLSHLSLTALLIYEAFWTAAVAWVPHLRRP